MKVLFKNVFSWFLSLFNVSMYLDSDIDSITAKLRLLDIEKQADRIADLYFQLQLIETMKCTTMLLSLLALVLANKDNIYYSVCWLNRKCKRLYEWLKNQIKKLNKFIKNPN
jgi:hypothetical protein